LNNGFTLKDVQEYMGHADIQITADIYGHLDVARKDMLSKGIESCIF
jgi:integrase